MFCHHLSRFFLICQSVAHGHFEGPLHGTLEAYSLAKPIKTFAFVETIGIMVCYLIKLF